mmetsp:Transcript_24649/g.44729  ORF Transcript_24649/g.44729 Transcript_24649/m.44729 type:complete len:80 (+) Transcript_24649:157-396(+)
MLTNAPSLCPHACQVTITCHGTKTHSSIQRPWQPQSPDQHHWASLQKEKFPAPANQGARTSEAPTLLQQRTRTEALTEM